MQLAAAISSLKRWAFPAVATESRPRAGGRGARGRRVHESGVSARQPATPRVNTHAEIVAFVAWMREHGFGDHYNSASILEFYRWFVIETAAPELARLRVLTALGEHPAVKRTRARLKDGRGKVIKLPSGSPARSVFYRIATPEPQLAESGVQVSRESAVARPGVQGAIAMPLAEAA